MPDRFGKFPWVDRVREYTRALGTPWTYAIHRNPYAVAGFLWGLPVPLFSVVLVQWASGGALTPAGFLGRLSSHPVYLILAVHPFLFAVLFGAFGTIREQQSRRLTGMIRNLELQAHTDGLTGLYNQRYFQESLPAWLRDASARKAPLCLALVDLDGLKPINDVHGHAQGDLVLRHVGRILSETARATDFAARTGGDEFAILLSDTALPEARGIAERLRAGVAAAACARSDGKGRLPVTVSIGLAEAPATGAEPEALLKAADDALYRAKGGGRNRVVG